MEELKREAQGCPSQGLCSHSDGVVPSKASFKSPHSGCGVTHHLPWSPVGTAEGPPPPLLLSGGRGITPVGTAEGPHLHFSCQEVGESPRNHQAQQLQSDPLQANHPKFCEQDHNKEAGIEEEQAEAICLAELETLKRDGDQGED